MNGNLRLLTLNLLTLTYGSDFQDIFFIKCNQNPTDFRSVILSILVLVPCIFYKQIQHKLLFPIDLSLPLPVTKHILCKHFCKSFTIYTDHQLTYRILFVCVLIIYVLILDSYYRK